MGSGGGAVGDGDDRVVLDEEDGADQRAVLVARGLDAFNLGDLLVVGRAIRKPPKVVDLNHAFRHGQCADERNRFRHGVH